MSGRFGHPGVLTIGRGLSGALGDSYEIIDTLLGVEGASARVQLAVPPQSLGISSSHDFLTHTLDEVVYAYHGGIATELGRRLEVAGTWTVEVPSGEDIIDGAEYPAVLAAPALRTRKLRGRVRAVGSARADLALSETQLSRLGLDQED